MELVKTQIAFIENKRRIRLYLKTNRGFNPILKKLPDLKWNAEKGCWHIHFIENHLSYLNRMYNGQIKFENIPDDSQNKEQKPADELSPEIENNLTDLRHYLTMKRYSDQTIQSYLSILKLFFQYFSDPTGEAISLQRIEKYNRDVILRNNYSVSYQNQLISALKHYCKRNFHGELKMSELERPRLPKKLPKVLSQKEIRKIIQHTKNLKHKTIISTIYSAGLRLGEATNLKLDDIDSIRMVIHIRSAKGNKDRMVNLSHKLLLLLREYYKQYKPSYYLFEGWNNNQYSTRSVSKLLKSAAVRAGIQKNVSVHMLRHSFATHLVESGTDIHYIQRLLGHTSIKTTTIYLHIAKDKLSAIRSPFDDI